MPRALIVLALTASLLDATAARSLLLDPLRALLSSIWSEPAPDEGCGFDPSGRCAPAPESGVDEGCGFDPDGRCAPAAQSGSNAGCGFDPNGCPRGS